MTISAERQRRIAPRTQDLCARGQLGRVPARPFGAQYDRRSTAFVAQQHGEYDSHVQKYANALLSEWDVDFEPLIPRWRDSDQLGAGGPKSARGRSRRGSLEHQPIVACTPERPAHLLERVRRAADHFDEAHQRHTAHANTVLRQLAEGDPYDPQRAHLFDLELKRVQRTRLAVDGEKQSVNVFAKREKTKHKSRWDLYTSIWKERLKTSDSKSFYDTPEVKLAAFEKDWATAARKYAFDKKLDREAKALPAVQASRCTVEHAKAAYLTHFDVFHGLFNHYASSSSGDDLFSISKKAFDIFLTDSALVREDVMGQRYADLMVLYEGINAKGAKDETFNHKKTLSREEWIGMLVQLVLIKHVSPEDELDVEGGVAAFVAALRPRLSRAACHDANVFRADYCYIEETDDALRAFETSLRALYEGFAYGDGAIGDALSSTKMLSLDEYRDFVDRLGLQSEFVTARDLDRAFAFSRMLVVDEASIKGRAKLIQLRFEDFLEALVRLAFVKALPTDEEIAQRGCTHAGEFLLDLSESPAELEAFEQARSCTIDAALNQSIGKKVYHFMRWIVYRVRGGVETGKLQLSKAEVERFKRGHVAMRTAFEENDEWECEVGE